jgi:hypothetical protein
VRFGALIKSGSDVADLCNGGGKCENEVTIRLGLLRGFKEDNDERITCNLVKEVIGAASDLGGRGSNNVAVVVTDLNWVVKRLIREILSSYGD